MKQLSGSDAGRALAALRKRVPGTCAVCGTPIEGAKVRRYCGNTCRIAAYRARQRAKADQGARNAES